MRVTTNEFGSFSGEFVLPKNGLTGILELKQTNLMITKIDTSYDKIKDEHPFWDNVDFENSQFILK